MKLFDDGPQPGLKDPMDVEGPTPTGVDPFDDLAATEPAPGEQGQYEQLITRAMQYLGDERNMKVITQALNNKRLKVSQTVGRFAGRLAKMLEQHVKAAGAEVSGEAMINAFQDAIVPKIFEFGEAAGIWELKPEEEQREMEDAVMEGTRVYGEMSKRDGTLPTQEARAFLQSQDVDVDSLVSEAEPAPMAAGVRRANSEMGALY